MKKLFAILLVCVFILSLSACTTNETAGGNGGNNNQSATSSQSSNDSVSSVPAPNYVAPSGNNQSNVTTNTKISKDKALEVALKHAGLKQDNIRDLEIELDDEKGVAVWEVDFESGNMEYSYDINAETGEIVKNKTERDD